MSITFDTERWSHPWRARDIEESEKRSSSPRVVPVGEIPFFKAKPDLEGEAFFRLFAEEEDPTIEITRRLVKRELDREP